MGDCAIYDFNGIYYVKWLDHESTAQALAAAQKRERVLTDERDAAQAEAAGLRAALIDRVCKHCDAVPGSERCQQATCHPNVQAALTNPSAYAQRVKALEKVAELTRNFLCNNGMGALSRDPVATQTAVEKAALVQAALAALEPKTSDYTASTAPSPMNAYGLPGVVAQEPGKEGS